MRSLAFRIIKYLISRKFPSIKWLTTKELALWLDNPVKPQPLVLDARNEVEYSLSHLQKAERIDPSYPNLAELAGVPKSKPIVVYCSVGYRSARIAALLEREGFSHVYNLEGSIFKWANERRPVFQDNSLTMLVHPYNARWGKLLRSPYRGIS